MEKNKSTTALLIIDMISTWDFVDADKLLAGALQVHGAIAALKKRCRNSGVPVIYANDNAGQWRSDFAKLVKESLDKGGDGALITRALQPDEEDYFVLKPKHSVFYGTPTGMLLRHLGVRRVILTGVASDQCILVSAIDSRMRDLDVVVPADCSASQSDERHQAVLRQLRDAHGIATPSSQELDVCEPVEARESQGSTTGATG